MTKCDKLIKELYAECDKKDIPLIVMTHNGLKDENFRLKDCLLGEGSELATLIVCLMEMNPSLKDILEFSVGKFNDPNRPRMEK